MIAGVRSAMVYTYRMYKGGRWLQGGESGNGCRGAAPPLLFTRTELGLIELGSKGWVPSR